MTKILSQNQGLSRTFQGPQKCKIKEFQGLFKDCENFFQGLFKDFRQVFKGLKTRKNYSPPLIHTFIFQNE